MADYLEMPLYVLSKEPFELNTTCGKAWTPMQIVDAVCEQPKRNQTIIATFKTPEEAWQALKAHAKEAWTRESRTASGWKLHGVIILIKEETCFVREGEEPSLDNVFGFSIGVADYAAESFNAEDNEVHSGYYNFEELADAALATENQEALNALGEWFERFGSKYWNGEKYEIDSTHNLRPIYREIGEDDFEVAGYELCY